LTLAVIAVFGAVAASAVVEDDQRNFDARVDLNRGLQHEASAQQAHAIAALRGAIPSLGVTIDPATGATRSLNNRVGYLTERNSGFDPDSIAAEFISENFSLLGLTARDVAHFDASSVFSAATGATRLYLQQSHRGIPVYNGVLQLNINRDGRIVSVGNAFMPDLESAVNVLEARIGAAAAVEAAFKHVGAAGEASEARLMWLPIRRGDARLVWNLQIETADTLHHYDLNVDAVSGEVWTRFDWVASDSYTVYEAPIESPIHTTPLPPSDARSLQVNPENATASPSGWFDAGVTIMDGNNVHACLDTNANNACDAGEPNCTGSPLNCTFAIDLTQAPIVSGAAAVANLFYWNNYIHDTQYLYGFDEAAGNFQEDNFGKGGAGSDSVNADAQDGSGNCNANFGTPSDGLNPRMQMYTCTNASPARDGDYDNLVIVHEYGHGISNRLVGGPNNVSCLNNIQQMGEGWSDLLGLIYTHQTGFADADARGVGSYLFDEPAVGGGIRTFPYSTSFAVNPDTYSTIGSRSAPHGVGSVWAEIAWEAYWEVVNAHGFDADLQNVGAGAGNHRMMLYITEGMKNTSCSPTFLDARDGIIQAATDNFGGADVCLLWDGFARRGLGVDATTPGPNSKSGTNGFQVPAACDVGPNCDNDGVCESNEDCTTCPNDCISGTSGGAVCGNGVCEAGDGEDCVSCAADCNGVQSGKPQNRFCCGDGDGQNPVSCGDSRCTASGNTCTNVPAPPGGSYCCGDATCEGAEDGFNCEIDCGPPPICGNNTTEAPEVCDGTDLGGQTCLDFDCTGGTLACAVDCSDYDISGCTGCGPVCLPKNASCSADEECCSTVCKNNGRCR
jgi:extracellular elastinolytic metalloproteinase